MDKLLKVKVNLTGVESQEFKSEVVTDFSRILIRMESTNNCNFKCTFCPHPEMERPKGFMDESFYENIICQAADLGVKKLDLRNFGEPMLDKRIGRMANYARLKGIDRIYIHTNGYGLSEKKLKDWGMGGISDVNISLSPKREFGSTRPGVNVDRLFSQIEKVMLSTTADYKDILSVDYIRTGNSTPEEEKEFLDWLNRIKLPKRIDIELHNWATGKGLKSFRQCHRLWTSITVLWDGRVSLCCLDYDGEVIIGNLKDNSLKEIINSDIYKEIRQAHINGFFIEKCASCDMPIVKDEGAKASFTKIG